jgi:hypothetical protein
MNSVIVYVSGSTTIETGVKRIRSMSSWMRTFQPVIGCASSLIPFALAS